MSRRSAVVVGFVVVTAAAAVAVAVWSALPADRPLVAYTAASLRPPMEAIRADYERDTGRRVELRVGASEEVLTQARLAARSSPGDLFLPADESYVHKAEADGLTAGASVPLARQRAVVLTAKGNPKGIATWADLTRDGVRVALAEPDAAAIGSLTRRHLKATGRWDDFDRRVVVKTGTVTESATAAKVGSVDAAVVWDSVAFQHKDLPMVRLPELDGVTARVLAAVLTQSPDREAAAAFARYVADPEHGLRHFREAGFDVDDAGR